MTDITSLTLPTTETRVRELALGGLVTLTGEITITNGLPTHRRILEYMQAGRPLPVDITEGAFIHLSAYHRENDGRIEVPYLTPTTSTRFNAMMPAIIRHYRPRVLGGKGGLDMACAQAMQDVGCVFLSFLGGGSPLIADAVRSVVAVGWDDLVAHYRLVRLRVEKLGPLVVAIDAHGNSIYDQCARAARDRLPAIIKTLDDERGRAVTG